MLEFLIDCGLFLESINILLTGKSFRTNYLQECVKEGEREFFLKLDESHTENKFTLTAMKSLESRSPLERNSRAKIKNKANNLPIQGGLDPKILLTNKENIKKNVDHYLNVFSGYPYIFNLGHGVLPETDPNMVKYIIDIIREKKA